MLPPKRKYDIYVANVLVRVFDLLGKGRLPIVAGGLFGTLLPYREGQSRCSAGY